MVEIPLLRFY